MANARETVLERRGMRSTLPPRRVQSGSLLHNILFALAFGVAAAIILGFVN